MNKNITLLFILLATNFALSTFIKPYPFSWAVKLLPMLLLIGVAWQKIRNNHLAGKLFILGLCFSACGDFILDYDRDQWFIFGLGSFFIAHLCYLASLKPYLKNFRALRFYVALFGYLIFGVVMLMLLSDGLEQLFVPVVAYMSILLLMALATVLSRKSNVWLIVGGISFVISDALIGFDKFYLPIENVHFTIMVSYYFAQYALLKGFIHYVENA